MSESIVNIEGGEAPTISKLEKKIYLENTYKSCCLTVDKRALQFFSQLTISLIIIAFSIYQLITSKSCEKDSLYSGFLTLVIGTWLPQPTIKKT